CTPHQNQFLYPCRLRTFERPYTYRPTGVAPKLFTRNGFEADHQVNGDESDEANNNHLPGIYGLLRERSALPDIGLNNPQGAATGQIIGYLFKKDTSGP